MKHQKTNPKHEEVRSNKFQQKLRVWRNKPLGNSSVETENHIRKQHVLSCCAEKQEDNRIMSCKTVGCVVLEEWSEVGERAEQ